MFCFQHSISLPKNGLSKRPKKTTKLSKKGNNSDIEDIIGLLGKRKDHFDLDSGKENSLKDQYGKENAEDDASQPDEMSDSRTAESQVSTEPENPTVQELVKVMKKSTVPILSSLTLCRIIVNRVLAATSRTILQRRCCQQTPARIRSPHKYGTAWRLVKIVSV